MLWYGLYLHVLKASTENADSIMDLFAGAQLLAHPADNVEKIEGADESDPTQSPVTSSVQASGQPPR